MSTQSMAQDNAGIVEVERSRPGCLARTLVAGLA
jgi:hypothetical protein